MPYGPWANQQIKMPIGVGHMGFGTPFILQISLRSWKYKMNRFRAQKTMSNACIRPSRHIANRTCHMVHGLWDFGDTSNGPMAMKTKGEKAKSSQKQRQMPSKGKKWLDKGLQHPCATFKRKNATVWVVWPYCTTWSFTICIVHNGDNPSCLLCHQFFKYWFSPYFQKWPHIKKTNYKV